MVTQESGGRDSRLPYHLRHSNGIQSTPLCYTFTQSAWEHSAATLKFFTTAAHAPTSDDAHHRAWLREYQSYLVTVARADKRQRLSSSYPPRLTPTTRPAAILRTRRWADATHTDIPKPSSPQESSRTDARDLADTSSTDTTGLHVRDDSRRASRIRPFRPTGRRTSDRALADVPCSHPPPSALPSLLSPSDTRILGLCTLTYVHVQYQTSR
ncbi:hypothetical protein C8Q74DRAFT_352039 [Fomes fomentarius]|nr:hypothetical protein C8Q74DRAFT_352039 [Fomes fomentarius]